MTLNPWWEIIQLKFCQHCLQSGFQVKWLTNETLQTIYGADRQVLNSAGGMSQLEKLLFMSKGIKAAKDAYMEVLKQCNKLENVKNHFITGDGEDILSVK